MCIFISISTDWLFNIKGFLTSDCFAAVDVANDENKSGYSKLTMLNYNLPILFAASNANAFTVFSESSSFIS